MGTGKTEVVSVRVEPGVKAALQAAMAHERRSMANMLEVMILAYCVENAIAVPSEQPGGSASEEPK